MNIHIILLLFFSNNGPTYFKPYITSGSYVELINYLAIRLATIAIVHVIVLKNADLANG